MRLQQDSSKIGNALLGQQHLFPGYLIGLESKLQYLLSDGSSGPEHNGFEPELRHGSIGNLARRRRDPVHFEVVSHD